jgi:F0F1-type ATP synthase assembly protein I
VIYIGFAWGMIVGLIVGGSLGVVIIAVLMAASKADNEMGAD